MLFNRGRFFQWSWKYKQHINISTSYWNSFVLINMRKCYPYQILHWKLLKRFLLRSKSYILAIRKNWSICWLKTYIAALLDIKLRKFIVIFFIIISFFLEKKYILVFHLIVAFRWVWSNICQISYGGRWKVYNKFKIVP